MTLDSCLFWWFMFVVVDVTENNKVVYVRSLLITLDVDYTDEWLVLWLFWGIISSWIPTLLFKSDCTTLSASFDGIASFHLT